MRLFLSILAGRILRAVSRLLHRGGTGLPGRIALKIKPDLLKILSKGVCCIVVTGTNGKTTSVRMIEQGLKLSGADYFANLSGANLYEGITTEFLMNSTLSGRCRNKIALLETDEFACREVCRVLQPSIIYVTNLFTDQVERYGGVKGARDGIAEGISASPDSLLVLNADDSVSSSLALNVPNRVLYFGVSKEASGSADGSGFDDVKNCICCGSPLEYDYRTFSHLGGFRCTGCGYSRKNPDYLLTAVLLSDLDRSVFEAATPDGDVTITVNLPELYNMYNALGTYASMRSAGIDGVIAAEALASFTCGFGRMEQFPSLGKRGGRMVLVKNGAGCDQVLRYLSKYEEPFHLCIYLNNNASDGVDISWLEDVSFESLAQSRVCRYYLSGMRSAVVHDRLLKAGIPEDRISVIPDCRELISVLNQSDLPVFLLPTYTGMMETRSEIVRQCGGKEYWEE